MRIKTARRILHRWHTPANIEKLSEKDRKKAELAISYARKTIKLQHDRREK